MPQQEYRYQYINGRWAFNQCYLHMHIVIRSTSWCGGCLVLIWHWRSPIRSSGPLQGSVMLVITACSLTENFVHSPTVSPCKFIAFPLNEGHILSLVGLCKSGIANHALLFARIASARHPPWLPLLSTIHNLPQDGPPADCAFPSFSWGPPIACDILMRILLWRRSTDLGLARGWRCSCTPVHM